MAPALPLTQLAHFDAVDETERISHRRRALASVNITPMDDDMGLQNQPSLAKDSQEMEQILVDLGNTDLAQADLLQAIKTLETGGDALSTGDTDAIFPLSGFELTDTVESEAETYDKGRLLRSRLERRGIFLLRRLRIVQARDIAKRISDEVAQIFDKSIRGARKDGGGRPMGLKALLKRVETTAALQASAASRSVVGPKYYQAGTSKGDASRSSIGIASGTLTGLEDTAGALRSHLSVLQKQLDSDATASSSDAESNDEAVTYNNPHQRHMPFEKRALWSWQKARASVASRWCWLQVQVQELEYKIRQHQDLHVQVREAKGPIQFEGEPVAYEGSLPGDEERDSTCARVRPLRRDTFKKRKLLQMHNLHIATNKASKPSDVRCQCMFRMESCSVCTGRAEPTQPAPPFSTLAPRQRLALVDPCYHPVLSDIKDVPFSIHMAALSSRSWFRSRFSKSWRGAHQSSQPRPQPLQTTPRPVKRHSTRLKRGRPPLSRKIKERDRDDDASVSGQERRSRSSTEWRQWRRQSYDIDNIVIPQSVAANTRPEILTYKEIITPKWRVMELPESPLNNGVNKYHRMSIDSEEEDISEAAVQARHTRAETRERNKYLRKRRSRRNNTDENNSHPQTQPPQEEPALEPEPLPLPLPALPEPQPQPQPQPMRHPSPTTETVRPYSPRLFPLPEYQYIEMLSSMPEGYRPITPETARVDEFESSSLSPMSPLVFEGDDPDDTEWEPSVEKSERRRSTFR